MLDGQTQLAESDLVYTRSLMAGEIFSAKEVLILGGGDGALLELWAWLGDGLG